MCLHRHGQVFTCVSIKGFTVHACVNINESLYMIVNNADVFKYLCVPLHVYTNERWQGREEG